MRGKKMLLSALLLVWLPALGVAQSSDPLLNHFKGVGFGSSFEQTDAQLQALGFVWYENIDGDQLFSETIATYDGLFYGVMVTIGAHFHSDVLVSMSVMVEGEDEGRVFRQLLLDHRTPKLESNTTNLLWFYPDGYVNWQPREGFTIVTFFSFKAFSSAQERSMS